MCDSSIHRPNVRAVAEALGHQIRHQRLLSSLYANDELNITLYFGFDAVDAQTEFHLFKLRLRFTRSCVRFEMISSMDNSIANALHFRSTYSKTSI
jgi:hypothetical protein